jgi:hypothetical protein
LNLALVPGELTGLFGGGGPAGEEFEAVSCGGVGWCGVDEQGESGVGRELHGFEVEVECADDGVVEFLVAGAVEAAVWAAQRVRKSSLRVESSPMSSMSCLSWGLWPASERSMAAMSSAARSQSVKNSRDAGST